MMKMETAFETSMADVLVKVGVFLLVQALVYFIISRSSGIFSKSKIARSYSFRPPRSASIRRILGIVSDLPSAADDSPTGKSADLSRLLSSGSFKIE